MISGLQNGHPEQAVAFIADDSGTSIQGDNQMDRGAALMRCPKLWRIQPYVMSFRQVSGGTIEVPFPYRRYDIQRVCNSRVVICFLTGDLLDKLRRYIFYQLVILFMDGSILPQGNS